MNALDVIKTEAPYKDRFTFEIVGMGSERGKASDEKYDWENEGHGLVVLSADGTLLAKIPGHKYERPEIIEALDGALK